jgi:hypothetical protein
MRIDERHITTAPSGEPPSLACQAPGIARPVLRRDCPIIWRGTDIIQLGAGDDAPILDRTSPALVRWLLTLDGLRTWAQIDAEFAVDAPPIRGSRAPVSHGEARRALNAAARAGCLDDAAAIPHHWRWLSLADRDRSRADRAAAALTCRDSLQANELMDRRHALNVGVTGSGRLAEEIASTIELSGLTLVSEGSSAIDIRVLADGTHPRVVDEVDTPAHDRPHLAAGLYGSTGIAGPLVVPGITGCLRCSHLHACDAQPHWPAVSLQLASATRRLPVQPHDRLLTRLVAAQSVLLLRQWADDPTAFEHWADHAIEIRLPSGAQRRLARLPHPLCGCRWADADRAAS